MAEEREPQWFIERAKAGPSEPDRVVELAILKARQKLTLTVGAVVLVLLVVGGIIGFILLDKWATQRQSASVVLVPTRPEERPPVPSLMVRPKGQRPFPLSQGILKTPLSPHQPPSKGLLPRPPTPQVFPPPLDLPSSPEMPQFKLPPMPKKQRLPKAVLDYLEKLRRIEQQRKRESKNYWVALQTLYGLLKGLQGLSATGDVLETPLGSDPQKTLQAYTAYQARFIKLRRWLHQLRPPPECQRLHLTYDWALQTHIAIIETLKQKIQMKDLTGVVIFGLRAQGRLDDALHAADSELETVCNYYGIHKSFTIGDR